MVVLGIIPARGGSKRILRKNLAPLGGKPLVAWVIEAGQRVKALDRLVVSSDDRDILELARGYDAKLPLERPAELATDTAPAIAYVRHALSVLEAQGDQRFDIIVILQPSSPLTTPEDVDRTMELLQDSGADTAVTVMRLDHAVHPAKLKVMTGDRLLPYLEEEGGRLAAHELPPVFVRNGAVYATRRHVVDSDAIIGADCRGLVMPRQRSLDINDAVDLAFAEFLLERSR